MRVGIRTKNLDSRLRGNDEILKWQRNFLGILQKVFDQRHQLGGDLVGFGGAAQGDGAGGDEAGAVVGIEVKASATVKAADFKGLKRR